MIDREALKKAIDTWDRFYYVPLQGVKRGCNDDYTALVRIDDILHCIDNMPAADAQSANQWISVDDRLPPIGESVLVSVIINAKLNLPFRTDFTSEIRIGWLEENGKWGLQFDSIYNEIL